MQDEHPAGAGDVRDAASSAGSATSGSETSNRAPQSVPSLAAVIVPP